MAITLDSELRDRMRRPCDTAERPITTPMERRMHSAPPPITPMSDNAQEHATEHGFLDEVCEGRPRAGVPESPHELVERHAVLSPDAVALRHRDRSMTFADLNARANRLSRFLSARGIGAESRVVVAVEPGLDIVVALLAILKAGAVYVPLDPAYPAAHLRTILDDTKPSLVIATRCLSPELSDGVETLLLDEADAWLPSCEDGNPGRLTEPDRTAYVFYTSGTTGKPKGVMASYANLASYVAAARERYGFTSADVMPAIARFSFSISLFELLTPLSAAGTLVVLDRDHVMAPSRLAATIREVTIFHAGPSLLRPLLEYIRTHDEDIAMYDGVRHASSGGDLIPPEVLESAKDTFRKAEVFVIYGCSEIACMGCTYEVPRDRRITKTYVGRPFDGMAVRVVDESLERVAVGEVGEICFSGAGVVKGYLNRAELTASRFVEMKGRRFYRTGDVGRVTGEGFVEILGRTDFQAKIRGMRVELGEVEYHLRRAPRVKEGVVMPRDGADGEKVLVAYVVLDGAASAARAPGEPACAVAIRRHMVQHLPDYMVPAIYLELEKLPLNHNLKVDRRALPAPARDTEGRAPETQTERALASIWRRLLGVEQVCLDDNFFELGGHSLLAVALLVDVKRDLGVQVDGMDVLREPLEVLARICDVRRGWPPGAGTRAASSRPAERRELFHFGAGRTLYGVLTRPAEPTKHEAVLVCPPVGQEKTRAHFVLQSFAKRLAARGITSFVFDYYGTGDSLGESVDATLARWQGDILDAFDELARRTDGARITAVGARLGATLLGSVAPRLDVAGFVFWDPVLSGSAHLSTLRRLQRDQLAAAERFSLRRGPRARGTELLGTTYSAPALDELAALALSGDAPRARVKALLTRAAAEGPAPHPDDASSFAAHLERLDVDCSWYALDRLEDTLPDVGISTALTALCTEAQ